MSFARPEMLWMLALTVPLLSWFLWWGWRKRQTLIRQFVQSRLLAQLTVGVSRGRQKLRLLLLVAAVALILLALARPLYGFVWQEVHQRGLDIVVAIDTSRSMLAEDLPPNRITRAKYAALDLMSAAKSDRLALEVFAGTAFLQCPLTVDQNAFIDSVNTIKVGIIPRGGTDLGQAIKTALTAFKTGEDNFRVLVLLTDGGDLTGDALAEARVAKKHGLRIYPIGVGTAAGGRIRLHEKDGTTRFVVDAQGHPVVAKLESGLLRQIASVTGGEYLPLQGANTMERLYSKWLAPLPKTELSSRLLQQYDERFQWPLGAAILLLIAELFVPERKRVPRPAAAKNARKAAAAVPLAVLLLLAGLPSQARASGSSADKAYQAGHFRQAEREYEELLRKHPNDPRLLFNAGTAAYRAGNLQKATNALSEAILSTDPNLLAKVYYNLGNACYRLGEHAANPQETITNWEQSVAGYDSALKLAPKDPDARFNRSLVARRLAELKKELKKHKQQQQKQSKQQKKNQNQKKQQQQNQKNQQKKRQNQRQQQKQDESQSKQRKQGDRQRQQQAEQNKPKSPPKPASADKKQKQHSASSSASQPKPPKHGTNRVTTALAKPGEMTPKQARQLLDAARAEEKPLIFLPRKDRNEEAPVLRNW